jgi:putative flippase GtrA
MLKDTYFYNFMSNVIAVLFSTIYCYIFNRLWGYRSNGKKRKEAPAYLSLTLTKIIISSFLVAHLHILLPKIEILLIKILIDITLFFVSYYIQSKYIFKKH